MSNVDGDLSIGPPPIPEVSTPTGDPFAPPPPVEVEPELAPEVPEPVVRGLLATMGGMLTMSPLGDPDVPEHWRFTTNELDDLTPPLTRMVNARPALRAAAARGDELTIAVQLAGYAGRNVIAGAQARNARALLEEETNAYQHGEAFGPAAPGHGGADGDAVDGPEPWVRDAVGVGIFPPAD